MIEISDDGFIDVRIGDIVQQIDIYEVYNRINEALKSTEIISEQNAKLQEIVERCGFPRPSQRVAVIFANSITSHIEELSKKGDGAALPSQNAA